jgi:heat shock protein HtpX
VPAVYVIEEPAPNAFATGRDPQHSSIAVTRGMMQMLDREELQGVVAHEMSHIRNYDIRFATLVGILVGMIALVADFFLRWSFWGGFGRRRGGDSGGNAGAIMMVVALVLAILAPLAAYGVQFAISRRREYLADASAVELTRNPLGLARALNDIAGDPQPLRHANRATAHLYIANPLKNKKTKEVSGVFDTHPPIQKRIAILLEMARMGPEALVRGRRAAVAAGASAAAEGLPGAAGTPSRAPLPPPHDPPPPPAVPPASPA